MQSERTSSYHAVNYYTILGLPPPRSTSAATFSKHELRTAYRQALLLNHPDKVSRSDVDLVSPPPRCETGRRYSIDEIMRAYQTLAEPSLKTAYDHSLLEKITSAILIESGLSQRGSHLGVEVYDLEDLDYTEEEARWYRSCRCGDAQGYTVTESELEKESKEREIYVGCRGCSLFIKVVFDLVEEDDIA